MFIQASTRMLLRGAMLIVLVIIAMPAGAQESAIPNFTSANFGWLVNSGFDFRPVAASPDAQDRLSSHRDLCGLQRRVHIA